jgi:hypothetical protein
MAKIFESRHSLKIMTAAGVLFAGYVGGVVTNHVAHDHIETGAILCSDFEVLVDDYRDSLTYPYRTSQVGSPLWNAVNRRECDKMANSQTLSAIRETREIKVYGILPRHALEMMREVGPVYAKCVSLTKEPCRWTFSHNVY